MTKRPLYSVCLFVLLVALTSATASAQKVLVVYYSEGGHTTLMAEAVAAGAEPAGGHHRTVRIRLVLPGCRLCSFRLLRRAGKCGSALSIGACIHRIVSGRLCGTHCTGRPRSAGRRPHIPISGIVGFFSYLKLPRG